MKHDATLCLPVKEGKILLGIKKRGFGKGKINGFGGKVRGNENIEEATIREILEEVGLKVSKENLKKVAELDYTFPYAQDKNWDQVVHVFLIENWENEPRESEEMGFEWFDINNVPFDSMWDSDKYWLPLILQGKRITANFVFNKDNNTIGSMKIKESP